MTAAALIAALALAAGEPSAADLNWSTLSHDAAVELTQTAESKDACKLTCSREGGQKELWSAGICLATKNQLRFVSNDGERIIVLDPLPALGRTWQTSRVAFIYARSTLARSVNAGAFVKDAAKVRELQRHFYWLAGHMGVPGNPPKHRDDATGIDLESIDGKTRTLKFDGSDAPRDWTPPAKRAPKTKKKGK